MVNIADLSLPCRMTGKTLLALRLSPTPSDYQYSCSMQRTQRTGPPCQITIYVRLVHRFYLHVPVSLFVYMKMFSSSNLERAALVRCDKIQMMEC